ncbi:MAG: biotin/lipoyl-binding protein [Chloroflexaceae bacterium]|nr:biotin/lipoyl-binding protein [Chloroflexaceae bacterium]
MKKLRVTVNGVSYDVEVEILEDDDEGGINYGFPPSTGVPRTPPHPRGGAVAPPVTPVSGPSPSRPGGSTKELTSPIAGVIAEVKVSGGDLVKENDPLIVIEAMKMHTNISSPVAGKVQEIKVKPGDAVQQGQVLLTFE